MGAGAIVFLALMAAASAAASPGLSVSPAHPHVDDNLWVTFADTRALPAGHEIDVVVFGTGTCASSLAAKTIRGPLPGGHRFGVRLRPGEQVVGGGQWCQGKAKVRVTEALDESFLRMLGEKAIRFRSKP